MSEKESCCKRLKREHEVEEESEGARDGIGEEINGASLFRAGAIRPPRARRRVGTHSFEQRAVPH